MLDRISAAAAGHRLAVMGGFHPGPEDGAPAGTRTLLLLGPMEPGHWDHLSAQPEMRDGRPDPVDRWSRRVIGRMACDLGGKAVFPFTGPPYHPFQRWAQATGRAWQSPVRLLVHDTAGLMVAFRGALALRDHLDLPATGPKPCDTCARPCLTACPAGALTGAGYDVPACHDWLDRTGQECLSAGCLVRRACPLSQSYGRVSEQSAYHMRQFHT
ncbi:MAG: ferredoxin [Gemmobacter sp.]|nr:ferredoxin [Gemmobacter sp.]